MKYEIKINNNVSCTPHFPGIVVQLVRAPPCQGGSCGFEPRQSRPALGSYESIDSSLHLLRRGGDKEQDLIPGGRILISHFSSGKGSSITNWIGDNLFISPKLHTGFSIYTSQSRKEDTDTKDQSKIVSFCSGGGE
jgi:hypothetical protein